MSRIFDEEDEPIGRIHEQLEHLQKIAVVKAGAASLTRRQIAELVETMFWVSLQQNEGRPIRTCVTAATPDAYVDAMRFQAAVPCTEAHIVKLAPSVRRGGSLFVQPANDTEAAIWGMSQSRLASFIDALTLEVAEPGKVRVGIGPFQPFAVLDARTNPVLAASRISLAGYLQRALQKKLPTEDILETQAVWRECLAIADLTRGILLEGHGGMLLVVPSVDGDFLGSLNPFSYRLQTPDSRIRDAIRFQLKDANDRGQLVQRIYQADLPAELSGALASAIAHSPSEIGSAIAGIASLSAVDGAIVVTRDLKQLGFGATISVAGAPPHLCMFRPESGKQPVLESPLDHIGGTRHQSAARFAFAHHEVVAVVISQDHHVSLVHWHEDLQCVVVVRNVEWWVQ